MAEQEVSNNRPLIWGVVAALVTVAVIYFLAPAPETTEVAAPVVETVVEEPEEVVAEVAPEPMVPEFDTFRVDPDGAMVIAGRAEPNQGVDVILGGEVLERATADGSGSFVALPMAGFSDVPRRLSLLADPDGAAIASTTSYIVAPISPPVTVAAAPELQPEPEAQQADASDVASEDATITQADVPEAPLPPALPDTEEAIVVPTQPTVIESDADGVRVVQAGPSITTPEEVPNVALDAITYDPDGDVQISGRAIGDGEVQVYLDNEPVSASDVTQGGDWRIDLPEIDTGVYTLRIDELNADGDVVSRVETPFKREEPEDVAAVLAEDTAVEGFEVAVRTVQPGSTLWAIAEESLGEGIRYVEVFEANRDLIRDPDLIYPGQIFRMPDPSQ